MFFGICALYRPVRGRIQAVKADVDRKRPAIVIIIIAALFFTARANECAASIADVSGLSLGPSVGVANYPRDNKECGHSSGRSSDVATSFDVTYGIGFPQHAHVPAMFWPWISAGFRYYNAPERIFIPYLEMGISLFVMNMGIGYSYVIHGVHRHSLHLFVGVLIPVNRLDSYTTRLGDYNFYVQPYYRPVVYRRVFHEAGLMVKIYCSFSKY
jgi:hypothetical protein